MNVLYVAIQDLAGEDALGDMGVSRVIGRPPEPIVVVTKNNDGKSDHQQKRPNPARIDGGRRDLEDAHGVGAMFVMRRKLGIALGRTGCRESIVHRLVCGGAVVRVILLVACVIHEIGHSSHAHRIAGFVDSCRDQVTDFPRIAVAVPAVGGFC